MLSPEVWAEVRRLHEDGVPIKRIARDEGLAPNTVRRLVRADVPPCYQRPARVSVAEPFEARIARLVQEEPWLTAAVIGRRVRWPASMSLLRAHVARLRAAAPARVSTQVPVPELGWAECGLWWPEGDIAVGYGQQRSCPVLVMVAGHSRRLAARLLPTAHFADVWAGHHQLFQDWGRVPHTLRWDPDGIVSFWGDGPDWSAYVARAELGGTAVLQADERFRLDSLTAARVFLQGQCPSERRFSSPADFTRALQGWLDRFHGEESGSEVLWAVERAAMRRRHDHLQPLLDAPPGNHLRVVPDRDGLVWVRGNGYLVGDWGARRRLTVEVTDAEVVIRSSGYQSGGFHTVTYPRVWAEGVRVDDPVAHWVIGSGDGSRRQVEGP